jgi:chromosome segregation protein
MVEHLFPGGRGALRRVTLRPVRDEERPSGEQEAPTDAEPEPEPEEEEEQREELGVEIEVTPAGKSTRKLSLLSGGEKSLVALAFVFAVFLARPCPFYILDEVEAALDDANIDRFLQLVRRFSDRAQFVIVTHQKRTMDAADVLYGVTMGDDGVTKVVSRRLPREESSDARDEATDAGEGPPPFAGIAVEAEAEAEPEAGDERLGEARQAKPAPGSVEAA